MGPIAYGETPSASGGKRGDCSGSGPLPQCRGTPRERRGIPLSFRALDFSLHLVALGLFHCGFCLAFQFLDLRFGVTLHVFQCGFHSPAQPREQRPTVASSKAETFTQTWFMSILLLRPLGWLTDRSPAWTVCAIAIFSTIAQTDDGNVWTTSGMKEDETDTNDQK